MEHNIQQSMGFPNRHSFLHKGLAVGGAIGAGLLANGLPAFAEESSSSLTQGDVAILRFLVLDAKAAEPVLVASI